MMNLGIGNDSPAEKNHADKLVGRVLDAQRRRLRLWTGVIVAAWIFVAGYLAIWMCTYLIYVHPSVHMLLQGEPGHSERQAGIARALVYWLQAIVFWPALLFAASVGTIALMVAYRRATLRQIQVNLAEISAQMGRLSTHRADHDDNCEPS